MGKKKVLIITYYWPPGGGAGVQRWLKFVKYLRLYGWEPIVYTPENPEAPAIDTSLEKDIPENLTVLKTKVWEPYAIYKRLTGQKPDEKIKSGFLTEKEKPGFLERLSVWIRGNFFIPDARKFWIKPSVKFLTSYLKDNPVDLIVSTGPPHSMHLIALGIKKKLNLPWLADFRDPWTNIDFYHKLKLTARADKKHKRLEKEVLDTADKVICISYDMAKEFEEITSTNIEVITNGYDEEDFKEIKPLHENKKEFEILHLGSMNADRNPVSLWKALQELKKENPVLEQRLKITFIGFVDITVKNALRQYGLTGVVEMIPYLPHGDALRRAAGADVLLLALNDTPNVKGILPGKMFEYLALKSPILGTGDTEGDAANILLSTNAGKMFDFEDITGIKEFLLQAFNGEHKYSFEGTERFSRKYLTRKMSEVFQELTEK